LAKVMKKNQAGTKRQTDKGANEAITEGLKVFIVNRGATCDECGEDIDGPAWITLREGKGALCLACADLEQLVFLPVGNMALTRRARKNSRLAAVVLKWSRARKRYERQGLLVEEQGLEAAEKECLADADAREAARIREAERRAEIHEKYVLAFAQRVRELYPACPSGRERAIAEHACRKYSGRVGRSAAAKVLDATAIRLAVIAHIRHVETRYDELMGRGCDRFDARQGVEGEIMAILDKWAGIESVGK
jgi:hypothetical protein